MPPVAAASGLEPHIAAALCYLPIFPFGLIAAIIFLLAAPYNQNKFLRFHAFQSIFLGVAVVALSFVLFFFALIVTALLHFLAFIFIPVWPLLWLGIIILFLYMMYTSFNNKIVKLPFIGDLAQKQA